jgi:hypothetical protein
MNKVETDKWELQLNKELEKLKSCQTDKKVDSCLKCKEILECEVRKHYVQAVYESMNKGEDGGFEF